MARVKISEWKAKKLILGDEYRGIQLNSGAIEIPEGHWVAKVDQGIKKRFKQGLLTIDKPAVETKKAIEEWEEKGFSQFVLEPLFPHESGEEQYLSLERVREGIQMLHAANGGVDIESNPGAVQKYLIRNNDDISNVVKAAKIPEEFLRHLLDVFNKDFFAFLEINPLIVRDNDAYLLDAAVLVDDTGEFFTHSWNAADSIRPKAKHPSEEKVAALDATTPASLKLSVIDPDASLFFLLSGGGGSIVIADEAALLGAGTLIANYGEYSGGPSREETYLYAKHIIALMLDSKASKKALVIAGGVANFTDVKKTFGGIIDALSERAQELRMQDIRVFVRRGGPNELAGLSLMREFLEREQIMGSMYGSEAAITSAIDDAVTYVRV